MDKILIASPIRQKKYILREYLKGLDELYIGEFNVERYFVLHNCYEELIPEFNSGILNRWNDETDTVKNTNTHNWKKNNLNAMSQMKNMIVEYALKYNYDYIFWVDSDTVVQPETLAHLHNILVNKKEYICGEILWTEYQDGSGKMEPNCWEYDFFSWPENYYKPNRLYHVGGVGGLLLVNTDVYRSGVNYTPLPNLQITNWEDRAFCIRATCHDYKIFVDTHYPAIHLYRDDIYNKYMKSKGGNYESRNL